MTHAKTQRRKVKQSLLVPKLQLGNALVCEAPASSAWMQTPARFTSGVHEFTKPLCAFASLRETKNLPSRSLLETLHPFLT